MKVWIIDDNNINCYVLCEMLSNYTEITEIKSYTNPIEFLNILTLSEDKPDIILTDIMMPGMDGYELSTNIKKLFSEIRIIGITALPKTKNLLDITSSCGMESVIFKPYDMNQLLNFIKYKE
jgi:CheY-like chemotaxis protein